MVVEWQEEDNAFAPRIEATIDGVLPGETKNQPDTAGMVSHLKERLTPADYVIWQTVGQE